MHSLIKYSQHGFTKGRSCLTDLLSFFSEICEAVDNDRGYDIIIIIITKAFDEVLHERLIKVEAQDIGKVLIWIKSWIMDRKQVQAKQ